MNKSTLEILDGALTQLQLRMEHLIRVRDRKQDEIELLKQNISLLEEAVYTTSMELGGE